jgi:hypothetical protein
MYQTRVLAFMYIIAYSYPFTHPTRSRRPQPPPPQSSRSALSSYSKTHLYIYMYQTHSIIFPLISPFKGVMARRFYRNKSVWVQCHTRAKLFSKRDKWICSAPRASGLRWKRQCGVPISYEERKKDAYFSKI